MAAPVSAVSAAIARRLLVRMNCYSCERESTQRCSRCGNPYCPPPGASLCGVCMDPLRSVPSRGVFRIALFGLFGGAVLALWLLVRPPSVPGQESITRNDSTATPALTPAGAGGGATTTPAVAAAGSTPEATVTPVPTATPLPTPVPTPAPVFYTVQSGDTWDGIAGSYGVNPQSLASINGHTLDDILHP